MKITTGIYIIVLLCFIFLAAQPIHVITSDIGRHITSGKLILSGQKDILAHNIYSYTNPDYPTMNHHWGSSVILYLIYHIGGFPLVSIATLFLLLCTLILFLRISPTTQSPLIALFILPLITARTEPRPEIFSYLLAGIFLYLLNKNKYLWMLPMLELVWVNLHIYFPLGIIFVGLYGKKHWRILLACIAVTLLNPHGLPGALAPLTILSNYGYPLLENRSLLRIWPSQYPLIPYIYLGLFVSCLAIISSGKKHIRETILLFIGISTVIFSIRNISLFGLLAIGYVPSLLTGSMKSPRAMVFFTVSFLIITLATATFWIHRPIGIGLDTDSQQLTRVFRQKDIQGPIFNNYDIGGYLIYELYPRQHVFVDNRPEAYPKTFFNDTYIPMHAGSTWDQMQKKYGFRTIIWAKTDVTAWGMLFLSRMKHDRLWHTTYEDTQVVLFTKL